MSAECKDPPLLVFITVLKEFAATDIMKIRGGSVPLTGLAGKRA